MLEKVLSPGARAIYLVALAGWGAGIGYSMFRDLGPAAWFNDLQAQLLGGWYSPELTFLGLLIPGILVSWPLGYAFDAVTGQGRFDAETAIETPETRN